MARFEDLTGKRFGRLEVVCLSDKKHNGRSAWLYKCDCGNSTTVSTSSLTHGRTQSCGCFRREQLKKANSTHELSKSRLYRIWCHMKERCYNHNDINYHRYGGRGIKVCDEWENFESFCSWALSSGYSDNLTIDRINNNSNYSPDNCRWVTMETQANNRRTNHFLTHDNRTQTLAQWAREYGIKYSVFRGRIRRGWSFERAVTERILTK